MVGAAVGAADRVAVVIEVVAEEAEGATDRAWLLKVSKKGALQSRLFPFMGEN
jgi:hypothetical protein